MRLRNLSPEVRCYFPDGTKFVLVQIISGQHAFLGAENRWYGPGDQIEVPTWTAEMLRKEGKASIIGRPEALA